MLPAHSWYRCPELLLGARSYSTGVDVWAAGCIFAELMLRVPFMAAESDMDQLDVIFSALGTPTEQDWPVRVVFLPRCSCGRRAQSRFTPAQGFTKLASGATFEKKPKNDLSLLFSAASSEAIDLLQRMLAYDPRKRITSREVRRAPCSLLISPNTKETHSHTRTHARTCPKPVPLAPLLLLPPAAYTNPKTPETDLRTCPARSPTRGDRRPHELQRAKGDETQGKWV